MDSEETLRLLPDNKVRGAGIRDQHRLLNQAVRVIMFTRQNRGDASGFVCLNIGFAGFKINGAALLSRLSEHFIE